MEGSVSGMGLLEGSLVVDCGLCAWAAGLLVETGQSSIQVRQHRPHMGIQRITAVSACVGLGVVWYNSNASVKAHTIMCMCICMCGSGGLGLLGGCSEGVQ